MAWVVPPLTPPPLKSVSATYGAAAVPPQLMPIMSLSPPDVVVVDDELELLELELLELLLELLDELELLELELLELELTVVLVSDSRP